MSICLFFIAHRRLKKKSPRIFNYQFSVKLEVLTVLLLKSSLLGSDAGFMDKQLYSVIYCQIPEDLQPLLVQPSSIDSVNFSHARARARTHTHTHMHGRMCSYLFNNILWNSRHGEDLYFGQQILTSTCLHNVELMQQSNFTLYLTPTT